MANENKEIDALKKQVAELEHDIEQWRNDYKKLAAEYDEYRKETEGKLKTLELIDKHEQLIEIVAIPPVEGARVPPKSQAVKEFIDDDGFKHFLMPRPVAERILSDVGSPIKHVLVGPIDEIKGLKTLNGVYASDVPAIRHVRQLRNGKTVWVPFK